MTVLAMSSFNDAGQPAMTATTLVLGMGATGQSVARWLAREGATACFADEHSEVNHVLIRDILPDAKCMTGFDALDVTQFDQIVVSPGIPDTTPILQRAFMARVPVISDVELFLRDARARVVGVTGTNGKSTVVTLLATMCEHAGVRHAAGGNLGPPALDLPALETDDVYVLELSSYQLQRTHNLVLHAAAILNIAPDHLDWHRDFAEYRAAKARILADTAYAIVNADAPYVDLVGDTHGELVRFTLGRPGDVRTFGVIEDAGEDWLAFGRERLLPVAALGLKGRHNTANALAALALGSSIDLPMSAMLSALREFTGLAHRHEWV
ncbi:MAG: UDP-N-acetylmuramoyl-L-alanine--D-glutamate ligase, partial [Pseudomonadota bacterium]